MSPLYFLLINKIIHKKVRFLRRHPAGLSGGPLFPGGDPYGRTFPGDAGIPLEELFRFHPQKFPAGEKGSGVRMRRRRVPFPPEGVFQSAQRDRRGGEKREKLSCQRAGRGKTVFRNGGGKGRRRSFRRLLHAQRSGTHSPHPFLPCGDPEQSQGGGRGPRGGPRLRQDAQGKFLCGIHSRPPLLLHRRDTPQHAGGERVCCFAGRERLPLLHSFPAGKKEACRGKNARSPSGKDV